MESSVYCIRIQGNLTKEWNQWFEGMDVLKQADGTTLLSGPLQDQAALFGILKKIRNLGLPLVSVNKLDTENSKRSFQEE
jgi:hypothetical protein